MARVTRKSVLFADKAADWTIRIGGLLVIFAVLGIMVFLFRVVWPLFQGGQVIRSHFLETEKSEPAIFSAIDEYSALLLKLLPSDKIELQHLQTGKVLQTIAWEGEEISAVSAPLGSGEIALAFANGEVRLGRLGFKNRVLPLPDKLPGEALENGDSWQEDRLYSRIPGKQIRETRLDFSLDEPLRLSENRIIALDYRLSGTLERPSKAFAILDAKGQIKISLAESKTNMLTRKTQIRLSSSQLPALPDDFIPKYLLLSEKADQLYVTSTQGEILRFDCRDFKNPQLVERIKLLDQGQEVGDIQFLNGGQALILGTAQGEVRVYFRLPDPQNPGQDKLTLIHRLEAHQAAVNRIIPSSRSRMFLTAAENGEVWLRHSTTAQVLLKLQGSSKSQLLALSPRDNAIFAQEERRKMLWEINVPHPETNWNAIFGKVWYEGYSEADYVWQSSSGNDSFEPKLSLIPLIFGTIKAAFYSLLFAVPIAILAAIYSSEFLSPKIREIIKPSVELMASLPSVVLGFIAALVLAPVIENNLLALLLSFLLIPLALLVSGHFWARFPVAWERFKFPIVMLIIIAAAALAFVLASLLKQAGFETSGGLFSSYVQRNTLVVGMIMGFAVIPLIYTLAEDALSSVPDHLRASSLACGATPWQTATRVILPAAASGIFAAIMVGLGRAVGETMIVVMAAGNTPVIDWNIFNGLRALSANIAVELPEAVKDDTLYRVLFLAALSLFAMTFVINTLAEVVRQFFRKKTAGL